MRSTLYSVSLSLRQTGYLQHLFPFITFYFPFGRDVVFFLPVPVRQIKGPRVDRTHVHSHSPMYYDRLPLSDTVAWSNDDVGITFGTPFIYNTKAF